MGRSPRRRAAALTRWRSLCCPREGCWIRADHNPPSRVTLLRQCGLARHQGGARRQLPGPLSALPTTRTSRSLLRWGLPPSLRPAGRRFCPAPRGEEAPLRSPGSGRIAPAPSALRRVGFLPAASAVAAGGPPASEATAASAPTAAAGAAISAAGAAPAAVGLPASVAARASAGPAVARRTIAVIAVAALARGAFAARAIAAPASTDGLLPPWFHGPVLLALP